MFWSFGSAFGSKVLRDAISEEKKAKKRFQSKSFFFNLIFFLLPRFDCSRFGVAAAAKR
jgi:hypothetical protein